MSTAHRPTWDPAQAKDVKGGSRQFSTLTTEVAKRDLRAELLAAEAEARERKRKAEGKPTLAVEGAKEGADDESNKRRKLLQEALELDKDDDDDDADEKSEKAANEDADDDDDECEKEWQEREQSTSAQAERDVEIATANPLLNLAAALGQTPNGVNTTKLGTFAVKWRWDDDLIFKNQAMNARDKGKEPQFVNDLLRAEFHKKFMAKFIKLYHLFRDDAAPLRIRVTLHWPCKLSLS
ncbi:Cwf15/Cwc15 cell cycle control protein-domain-containing protein [Trametes maxima]|nr:Cwf15/Cwc15 cell cycle control protein-domain-containing protein [Trametes maxima]